MTETSTMKTGMGQIIFKTVGAGLSHDLSEAVQPNRGVNPLLQ